MDVRRRVSAENSIWPFNQNQLSLHSPLKINFVHEDSYGRPQERISPIIYRHKPKIDTYSSVTLHYIEILKNDNIFKTIKIEDHRSSG